MKLRKLPFIFIDDLLMTGLALESIFAENVEKNSSKIVELFDWSACFLTMHTSETGNLFNEQLAYYSPMLMVAFDLTPDQVIFALLKFIFSWTKLCWVIFFCKMMKLILFITNFAYKNKYSGTVPTDNIAVGLM
jgi:hypothetical protein